MFKLQTLFVLMLVVSTTRAVFEPIDVPEDDLVKEGDIMLGFLFPLSTAEVNRTCGSRVRGFAVQGAQSALYLIDEINADPNILPNVTLGYALLNDCGRGKVVLARTTRLTPVLPCVKKSCSGGPVPRPFYDVAAVVGPHSSANAILVSTLLSAHTVPQVSYTATSDSLSDKTKYDYFSRVVPPDKYQTEAMIELVDFYGWSYISTLHTEGNYGSTAIRNVNKNAKQRGICIAYAKEVTRDSIDEDFDEIVRALRIFGKARVVVLFLNTFHVTSLLAAITRNDAVGEFIWIGSEAFTRGAFQGLEPAAVGAFSMEIPSARVPGFEAFYAKQRPWNGYNGNPWYGEYYREDFACSNTSSCDSLYPSITDIPSFHWSHWPSKVMDSVNTIALSLHALISDHCPDHNGNRTVLKDCANGSRLLRYIRNVSFDGYSAKTIAFDDNGDLIGGYVIKQVRLADNGEYTHDVIGRWNRLSVGVELDVAQIQWHAKTTSDNSSAIPESVCAKPCAVGEYYIQREVKCCWECRRCRSNERLNAATTGCVTCDLLTWPDDVNYTTCLRIPPTYMRWEDPISIGLAFLGCAGILSLLFVTWLFIRNRNRKVIKGSSRELSGVIIIGMFVAFVTAVAFIYKPNTWSCYVNLFGFNISIAAIFAPLFIKMNRIYRLFAAAERCQVRVKLTGNGSQMFFAAVAILVQVGLSIGTAMFYPPTARLNMPVVTEKYVELQCDLQLEALLIPLSFNFLLLLLCAVFGFLTRRLPDNFNESWYIFISVVTTIFIWIAFLPTYLVAFYAYHKAALLSLALILNASVTLLCLFVPKLYAVYCIDEKNIKVSNFCNFTETEISRNSSLKTTDISIVVSDLKVEMEMPQNSSTINSSTTDIDVST